MNRASYTTRFLLLALCLLMAASASAATTPAAPDPALLHAGDLIFHTSRSSQSIAVQRATRSRWSHMGMIVLREGKPQVLEAVKTVRVTPLADWIARGEGGHFTVKRLRDAEQTLTPAAIAKLEHEASTFMGRPYDLAFEWSDERLYCSELVWKIYHRALAIDIGELQKTRDFNLADPIVAALIKQRYGTQPLPLDAPAISPAAMHDSPRLTTILER